MATVFKCGNNLGCVGVYGDGGGRDLGCTLWIFNPSISVLGHSQLLRCPQP